MIATCLRSNAESEAKPTLALQSMSTLGSMSFDGSILLPDGNPDEEFVSDKEALDPEGVGAKKVPTSVLQK